MAIVNGKRLYNSDKLLAVAKEDDRAAAEYAWLMAGISDDFGRFKLSPRRILGKAYESRPGITELMIADWLAIYEKHGLIQLYTVGGSTYAEWYKYAGDPPSQRRFHSCPEPPWTTHKHNKRCTFRDDVLGMQMGRQKGRQVPTQTPTQLPTAPLPSVPSVPSVPSEQITAFVAPAPPTVKPWSHEAVDDWRQFLGDTTSVGGRIGKAIKPLVDTHGWDVVRPLWIVALEEAVLRDDPSTFTAEQFGRTFVARLNRARGDAPRSPPAKQTVGEKTLSAAERFIRRGGELDRPEGVREGTLQIGDGLPPTAGRRDS